MAGTLTISTLSDGTNSTSSTNCIRGCALAWVRWNGVGGATINASYNVSSVTRNSTGVYTVNYTAPMIDSNYAWTAERTYKGGINPDGPTNITASSITLISWEQSNGTNFDSNVNSVTIYR